MNDETPSNISKARQLLFAMLAKISSADGSIDAPETNLTLSLLDLAEDDRDACIEAFSKARRNRKSALVYAEEFAALGLPGTLRETAYDRLWHAAISDRVLRATEKYLLRDICLRLSLPMTTYDLFYTKYHPYFVDEELNEPPIK